jgi:hypothetical protein
MGETSGTTGINLSKLVVISSFGPMASTVVASIVEKFGYLNLPVRKMGLTDYLLKKRSLNDSYMYELLSSHMINSSKIKKLGGVSVIERELNKVRVLDIHKIKKNLDLLKKRKFNSIDEMYCAHKNAYAKSVIYKTINSEYSYQIEMLTGRDYNFNPIKLYKSMKQNFDEVYFIHLNRSFESWCNSMVSQWFYKKNFLSLIHPFKISEIRKGYNNYKNFIREIPGLNLDFDKLFFPDNIKTINEISKYINVNGDKIDWENEKYDLYGSITEYSKTFTKFDDNTNFLSKYTRYLIKKKYKKNKISFFDNTYVSFFYLLDLLRFRLKK